MPGVPRDGEQSSERIFNPERRSMFSTSLRKEGLGFVWSFFCQFDGAWQWSCELADSTLFFVLGSRQLSMLGHGKHSYSALPDSCSDIQGKQLSTQASFVSRVVRLFISEQARGPGCGMPSTSMIVSYYFRECKCLDLFCPTKL